MQFLCYLNPASLLVSRAPSEMFFHGFQGSSAVWFSSLFFFFFGLFLTREPELCEATSSCESSLVGSRPSFHLGRAALILLGICRRTRAGFILPALIKGPKKTTNWRKSPDKTNILVLQIAPRMIPRLLSWWKAASSF